MDKDVPKLVAANYPSIATALLTPLMSLLYSCRQHCGGDIDKFLVILAVALRTTAHHAFASSTPEKLMSGELAVFPGYGANVRTISESLGIPKETVRRKVSELMDAGWLVRENGRIYFTAPAYQELAPVREQIEALAARNYATVAALLQASRRAA